MTCQAVIACIGFIQLINSYRKLYMLLNINFIIPCCCFSVDSPFVKFILRSQSFANKNVIIKEICLHVNFKIVNVNDLVKSLLAFRCCSPTLSARMLISRTTSCWLSFKKVSKTHSYNWYQPSSFYCIARQSACTCCRISSTTLQTITPSLTLVCALHAVPITIRLITPVNATH